MHSKINTVVLQEETLPHHPTTPVSIVVHRSEVDMITVTSDLASVASSRQQKLNESIVILDWVWKGLFKYCKFVTSSESMEYSEWLSLFALEENNITNEKKQWNVHKKGIVHTLNEKRGCVVESINIIFKSK